MDTYQPIFDAVRSRIGSANVGEIVSEACRQAFDVSHLLPSVVQSFHAAADAMCAPSAIYKPAIGIDGNKWCVLYGSNLQEGVAGFGDSPAEAMADFDHNWNLKIAAAPKLAGEE